MKKNKMIMFSLIAICFFACVFVKEFNSKVIRKGYVDSTDNGIIVIVDTTGEAWEWVEEEGENFHRWDNVKLIMDNNNTVDTIEDDVIKKIIIDKTKES